MMLWPQIFFFSFVAITYLRYMVDRHTRAFLLEVPLYLCFTDDTLYFACVWILYVLPVDG